MIDWNGNGKIDSSDIALTIAMMEGEAMPESDDDDEEENGDDLCRACGQLSDFAQRGAHCADQRKGAQIVLCV